MKLAILLPDLRVGGAELMRLQMARRWLAQGVDVEFVLAQAHGELITMLPAGATVIDLKATRFRNILSPLARYLRYARPDALLAAMWPLTVVAPVAARLVGFRGVVAISEHSPLSRAYSHKARLHLSMLRLSAAIGYRLACVRIGVSFGVADDMATLSKLPRTEFEVVHNPAAKGVVGCGALQRPALMQGLSLPLILSVGALKAVKRHDLLIEAFAKLPVEFGATLCILGEGRERVSLEQQVDSLGLSKRVLLPGYTTDTGPWYAHAELFVLASDYEGFGNVIVEALEHGLPVVSTDCPFGPPEILEDGKYGTLVPVGDVATLAKAIEEALTRDHDGEALKQRAKDFSVDKAADRYLGLLLPGWRTDACP